jgi:5'-nucleotidase
MKKKILITNDDGYEAKGLIELANTLRDIADVVVVAPSTEKSACAHSLTLTRPLRFISVDDDFYKLDDGTPADCIYLALHSIFGDDKPDLVISGINRGSNMGEDITYSGTAAGAMEGVLHGIPSVAISQVVDFTVPEVDYSIACKVIHDIVNKILNNDNFNFPLPERQFLNINIPKETKYLEYKTTYAGYRYYENDAHLHRNPRGEEYYWLGLHPLRFKTRENTKVLENQLCDFEAIEKGYVSITPIQLDLSAYQSMKDLNLWLK